MRTDFLFSHKSDHWATPKDWLELWHKRWSFTFDPCPLRSENNAISKDWKGRVFCNPPYSNIKSFVEKGVLEVNKGNAEFIVFLLPHRSSTKWYHKLIYDYKNERLRKCWKKIELPKRLRFGNADNPAPFDSVLLIYKLNPLKIDYCFKHNSPIRLKNGLCELCDK